MTATTAESKSSMSRLTSLQRRQSLPLDALACFHLSRATRACGVWTALWPARVGCRAESTPLARGGFMGGSSRNCARLIQRRLPWWNRVACVCNTTTSARHQAGRQARCVELARRLRVTDSWAGSSRNCARLIQRRLPWWNRVACVCKTTTSARQQAGRQADSRQAGTMCRAGCADDAHGVQQRRLVRLTGPSVPTR
jgi:hypothetical protein